MTHKSSGFLLAFGITAGVQLNPARTFAPLTINVISAKEWSKPSELGAILPPVAGFRMVETEARSLVGLNSIAACRLSESLQVDVSVKTGKRSEDNENVAILEIKGHGAPDGLSVEAARPWYDAAHDAIYDLFLTFSNKEAQQKLWEPLL